MVKIFTLVLWKSINVGRFTPEWKLRAVICSFPPPTRSGNLQKSQYPYPGDIPLPWVESSRKSQYPPFRYREDIPVRYPADITWPRMERLHKSSLRYPWGTLTRSGKLTKVSTPLPGLHTRYLESIYPCTYPCPLPGRGEDSGKQAG